MPTLEMPPDLSRPPEALTPPDHVPTRDQNIGTTALHGESAASRATDTADVIDDAQIEAGLEIANAQANGVDARMEDAGRVHDEERAYKQAMAEEVERAHTEALIENEIFDVYDEAARENDERNLRMEEEAKAEAAKQEATVKEEAAPSDLRSQAEKALEDAGLGQKLPAGSQVRRDVVTGNLIISSNQNHDVKVIEPQAGGRSRVVDYHFDKERGVLTISAQGTNTITARVGDYVPVDKKQPGQTPPKVMTLPSSVSQTLGIKRVIPLSEA